MIVLSIKGRPPARTPASKGRPPARTPASPMLLPRSIRAVRAKHRWALLAGALALGGITAVPVHAEEYSLGRATIGLRAAAPLGGRATVPVGERPTALVGGRPTARASSIRGPSVSAALASLQRSGAITQAVYQQDYSAYVAAKRSLEQAQRHPARGAGRRAGKRAGDRSRRRVQRFAGLVRCFSHSNATASGGRPNRCCPAASG